jgi:hypothetical protein
VKSAALFVAALAVFALVLLLTPFADMREDIA